MMDIYAGVIAGAVGGFQERNVHGAKMGGQYVSDLNQILSPAHSGFLDLLISIALLRVLGLIHRFCPDQFLMDYPR